VQVNWTAKQSYEWVNNFKILQAVFTAQKISKPIDIERLVRGKYQDNLEFCQWLKNFWDERYNGQEYDAVRVREEAAAKAGKGAAPRPKPVGAMKQPSASGAGAAPKPAAAAAAAAAPAPAGGDAKKPAAPGSAKKATPAAAAAASAGAKPAAAAAGAGAGGSDEKVAELTERLTKLRLTIEGVEKERNFYFNKLRDIEVLCQSDEEQENIAKAKILEILYATDEDFEQPNAEADAAAAEPAPEDQSF
jgi:RP/EB family microtubule-associated protein